MAIGGNGSDTVLESTELPSQPLSEPLASGAADDQETSSLNMEPFAEQVAETLNDSAVRENDSSESAGPSEESHALIRQQSEVLAFWEVDRVLTETRFLGQSLRPILVRLIQHGIQGKRLDYLLDIISTNNNGAHSRVTHVLQALLDTYSADQLRIAAKDDSEFESLVEDVKQSTALKYDFESNGVKITHQLAFRLNHKFGEDEAKVIVDNMLVKDIPPRHIAILLREIYRTGREPDDVTAGYVEAHEERYEISPDLLPREIRMSLRDRSNYDED
jgi:hypothetical protein